MPPEISKQVVIFQVLLFVECIIFIISSIIGLYVLGILLAPIIILVGIRMIVGFMNIKKSSFTVIPVFVVGIILILPSLASITAYYYQGKQQGVDMGQFFFTLIEGVIFILLAYFLNKEVKKYKANDRLINQNGN